MTTNNDDENKISNNGRDFNITIYRSVMSNLYLSTQVYQQINIIHTNLLSKYQLPRNRKRVSKYKDLSSVWALNYRYTDLAIELMIKDPNKNLVWLGTHDRKRIFGHGKFTVDLILKIIRSIKQDTVVLNLFDAFVTNPNVFKDLKTFKTIYWEASLHSTTNENTSYFTFGDVCQRGTLEMIDYLYKSNAQYYSKHFRYLLSYASEANSQALGYFIKLLPPNYQDILGSVSLASIGRRGDLESFKLLEPFLTKTTEFGYTKDTLLDSIVQSGNYEFVLYLHQNYPQALKGTGYTLSQCSHKPNLDLVKYLYEQRDDCGPLSSLYLSLANRVPLQHKDIIDYIESTNAVTCLERSKNLSYSIQDQISFNGMFDHIKTIPKLSFQC